LTENEFKAYETLSDPKNGPFSTIWNDGNFLWDGIQAAHDFWREVKGIDTQEWQAKSV
jgi:hypothetical protein